jgi:TldD protein
MRDFTARALDTAAQLGAEYADTRVVRRMDESIAIKSGRVEGVAAGESEGFGVRVLVDGAWGFASSNRLTAAEADRVAGQAVRIAKASATALRDRVCLDDRPAAHGSFETPDRRGPVSRSRSKQKIQLLPRPPTPQPTGRRASRSPRPATTPAASGKTFAATDGSFTEQTLTHVGAGVEANAIEGDEHQRRSYPDGDGGPVQGGWLRVRPRPRPGEPREPLARRPSRC